MLFVIAFLPIYLGAFARLNDIYICLVQINDYLSKALKDKLINSRLKHLFARKEKSLDLPHRMSKLVSVFIFVVTNRYFSYGETRDNSICGDLIHSSCGNNLTTNWNSKNVGNELKVWLKGIKIIHSEEGNDKQLEKLKKHVLIDPNDTIIKAISNVNCSTNMPVGPIWKRAAFISQDQFHDGFFYAKDDETGSMTGDEIIYLYSDLKTALIGKFQNGQMVEAKPSRVIRERCHRGIKEVVVAEPKAKSPTLTYHPPNQVQLGNQPKVTDPFDQTQIYIQNTIYGEGVFAKKKIHKGDIIAYYSGLLWNVAEQPLFTQNQTYEEMLEVHKMLMGFNETHMFHIPKIYWELPKFRATLGHKVNHSFKSSKGKFAFCYNPRYGHIRSIVATSDINKGEEVLVDYEYPVGSLVPTWYSNLYLSEMGKHWNECACQQ